MTILQPPLNVPPCTRYLSPLLPPRIPSHLKQTNPPRNMSLWNSLRFTEKLPRYSRVASPPSATLPSVQVSHQQGARVSADKPRHSSSGTSHFTLFHPHTALHSTGPLGFQLAHGRCGGFSAPPAREPVPQDASPNTLPLLLFLRRTLTQTTWERNHTRTQDTVKRSACRHPRHISCIPPKGFVFLWSLLVCAPGFLAFL